MRLVYTSGVLAAFLATSFISARVIFCFLYLLLLMISPLTVPALFRLLALQILGYRPDDCNQFHKLEIIFSMILYTNSSCYKIRFPQLFCVVQSGSVGFRSVCWIFHAFHHLLFIFPTLTHKSMINFPLENEWGISNSSRFRFFLLTRQQVL